MFNYDLAIPQADIKFYIMKITDMVLFESWSKYVQWNVFFQVVGCIHYSLLLV